MQKQAEGQTLESDSLTLVCSWIQMLTGEEWSSSSFEPTRSWGEGGLGSARTKLWVVSWPRLDATLTSWAVTRCRLPGPLCSAVAAKLLCLVRYTLPQSSSGSPPICWPPIPSTLRTFKCPLLEFLLLSLCLLRPEFFSPLASWWLN